MQQTLRHYPRLCFLLSCCLVVFLAACSSQPVSQGNPHATPGTTTAPTAPTSGTPGQTSPMPPTQTSCPAANSGRAAVIAPLSPGSHQDLIYVYRDTANTWHLRRYDATTGLKTDVYSTSSGQIEDAQVSADGQWVVFLLDLSPTMRTDASAKIQMIRTDGKGLQTLYCFPTNEAYSHSNSGATTTLPIGLQLSTDQKSLLFSLDTKNQSSVIYDLAMGSGQVQVVWQDTTNTLYMTSIITWLDNTSAYLLTQGRTQPAPPATVLLLNVAQALSHVSNPASQVYQGGGRMHELSIDSSFDGTKLFTDDCLLAGSPFKTTISVQSSHAGGVPQVIYQPPSAICVDEIRVISANTMLMLVTDQNASTSVSQHEVWTMSLNGTAQHGLNTLMPDESTFQFNPNSQYVWSNVSRDGGTYALQQETNQGTENLIFGSINGGSVTIFATSGAHTLTLVGWTTM